MTATQTTETTVTLTRDENDYIVRILQNVRRRNSRRSSPDAYAEVSRPSFGRGNSDSRPADEIGQVGMISHTDSRSVCDRRFGCDRNEHRSLVRRGRRAVGIQMNSNLTRISTFWCCNAYGPRSMAMRSRSPATLAEWASKSRQGFTAMTKMKRAEMHSDHRNWESEIQTWQEDVEAWRTEQAKLLSKCESSLVAHVQSLKNHIDAIDQHEQAVRVHERFVAERERSAISIPGEIEARLVTAHERGAETHELLRRKHEEMKSEHRRAMGRLMSVSQMLAQK